MWKILILNISISHLLKVNHLLFHPWWTSAKKMLYWKMMMIIIWSLLWQEVLWLFLCVGILPSASPQCRTFFLFIFFSFDLFFKFRMDSVGHHLFDNFSLEYGWLYLCGVYCFFAITFLVHGILIGYFLWCAKKLLFSTIKVQFSNLQEEIVICNLPMH